MNGQPSLFTVGHSNHTEEHFIELLRMHAIEVLADVRTQPFSRYTPHFNHESLRDLLPRNGIRYVFMGDALGGRPNGDRFYDAAGHVLYYEVAEADFFLQGLERLEKGISSYRVAIMCSEEDPLVCHRHRLVARVLHDRGVPIEHIRGDGRIETYRQVEPEAQQQLLFDELKVDSWKSLQSVLPKHPRESSLEN